mmetsp:Transcript_12298/g.1853  ORF Transcript_12298/g.1853 Transcript_12298/m.1853 type:complete len:84 (+) Transcript_12298:887-1138(+)
MYLQNTNECVFICKEGFKRDKTTQTCIPGKEPYELDFGDGEDPNFEDPDNYNGDNGDQKNANTNANSIRFVAGLFLFVLAVLL